MNEETKIEPSEKEESILTAENPTPEKESFLEDTAGNNSSAVSEEANKQPEDVKETQEEQAQEKITQYADFDFGKDVPIDQEALNIFRKVGLEKQYTQQEMQIAVDLNNDPKIKQAIADLQQKSYQESLKQVKKQWHKELSEDPQYGQTNLQKSNIQVNEVLKKFFPEGFVRECGNGSWDYPDFLRGLAKIANHPGVLEPESVVAGDGHSGEELATAYKRYPNMAKEQGFMK